MEYKLTDHPGSDLPLEILSYTFIQPSSMTVLQALTLHVQNAISPLTHHRPALFPRLPVATADLLQVLLNSTFSLIFIL